MRSIIISPHPDDETLGVGGTILKRNFSKHKTAWLIVTNLELNNKNKLLLDKKKKEIEIVKRKYKFFKTYNLNLTASRVHEVPLTTLINRFSSIFNDFKPNEVFIPHYSDAHTDHQKIYSAISATTKTFRYPFIRKILCYETISETGYGLKINRKKNEFSPNYYVRIDKFLKKKIEIAKIYKTEIKKHPFPRSLKSIRSLATIRGAESNNKFAEAFELLKFIEI